MPSVRLFLSMLVLVAGLACGGGGGGGSTPTSITAYPTVLNFTATRNGPLPPNQSVSFTFKGDGAVVGLPPGQTLPDWASPDLINQHGPGGTVAVAIKTTQLDPGTYTMTLRFVAGHKDGSNLVTQDVPVNYTVTPEVPVLTLVAPELNFQGTETEAPAPVSVEIRSNMSPFSWSLAVAAADGWASDWLSVSNPGGVSADTRVTVQVRAALRDTNSYVAYLVLKDGTGREVARARATYRVDAGFTLSPAPALTVNQGSAAAALVSGFDIHTTYNATHGASMGWTLASDQPWVTCSPASGTFGADTHVSVLLDPAALWTMASGQHVANLTLAVPSVPGLTATVPVSLSLSLAPALTVQGGSGIDLTLASTEASLVGQLQVATNLGPAFDRIVSWTASSDAPWLQLTTSSGTTGNPGGVAYQLDRAALAALATLATLATPATAHVSIVAGTPGIAPATASIPLTLSLPKIAVVSPYIGWTGRPGPVILRGSGFATSTPFQFLVGGEPVTARIVDDTEARLETPALATAQRAPIRVAKALGLDLGGPDLVVVDPPAYPAADLSLPNNATELVLDPERQAVLAYGWEGGQVTRHFLKDGAWATDALPLDRVSAITVAPDGKELLILRGMPPQVPNTANHVEPTTLGPLRSVQLPSLGTFFGSAFYWNDGACWLMDASFGHILAYPGNTQVPGLFSAGPMAGTMSLDRSVMVMGTLGPASLTEPRGRSIVSNGKVVTTRNLYEDHLSWAASGMSRDGSRFLNETSVYDASFNRLGALTPETRVKCLAVSPDGGTVYTSEYMASSGGYVFRRHPISAPAGPYPADATLPVTLPWATYPTRMVMSQDGGALFILCEDANRKPTLKVVPLG